MTPSPESAPSDEPSPTATPSVLPMATPTPSVRTPYQLLAESIAATEDAGSYHLETDTKMSILAEGLSLEIPLKFIGDTQAPDRVQGTMSVSFFGETTEFGIVIIGDMTYITDPKSGDWELTDDPDFPSALPRDFTGTDLSDIEDLVLVGVESLDGTEVYHLKGTAPSGAFRDFREAREDFEAEIQVEYWIGLDDSRLRQITAETKYKNEQGGELIPGFGGTSAIIKVVVTMKLSDFGRRVVIQAPQLPSPTPARGRFVRPTATPISIREILPTPTPTPFFRPEPTPTSTLHPAAPTATPQPFDAGMLVSPDRNPKRGGTFVQAGRSLAPIFDIHQCSSSTCIFPMAPVYDNLVRFDPFNVGMSSIISDLAHGWTVSNDLLTYTFFLRDARWHDGRAFTAQDVKATYDRIIFPPQGVLSIRKGLFEAVTSVEVIDSHTVRFNLREPRGYFLSALSLSWNVIYQKRQLDAHSQDLKAVKIPVGTGPFKFVDYVVGERWRHERNGDYWNPRLPYLDGMVIHDLASPATSAAALAKGELDYANNIGGPDIKAQADRLEGIVVNLYRHPSFCGFWYNVNREPWGDARMRRAVHWAIDKPALRQSFSHIVFPSPAGWIAHADPRFDGYWDKGTLLGNGTATKNRIGWRSPTSADRRAAKALMAQVIGEGQGLEGVDMVFRDLTSWRAYSPILQDQLQGELNIDTNLSVQPPGGVFDKMAKGEFDLGLQCTNMPLALLEDYWGLVFWSGGPQNWSQWKNIDFDKVYFEFLRASEGREKNALINKGMAILDAEVPMFISHGIEFLQAWRSSLKGHRRGLARSLYEPWRWEAAWLDK